MPPGARPARRRPRARDRRPQPVQREPRRRRGLKILGVDPPGGTTRRAPTSTPTTATASVVGRRLEPGDDRRAGRCTTARPRSSSPRAPTPRSRPTSTATARPRRSRPAGHLLPDLHGRPRTDRPGRRPTARPRAPALRRRLARRHAQRGGAHRPAERRPAHRRARQLHDLGRLRQVRRRRTRSPTPSPAAARLGGGLAAAAPAAGSRSTTTCSVHDATTGRRRSPASRRKTQGLDFLGAPAIADVTGDGKPEVIEGGDSSAIHAFTDGGAQASGFPKFTSGWVVFGPATGDIDSDGKTELVAMTREGYLIVWKTDGTCAGQPGVVELPPRRAQHRRLRPRHAPARGRPRRARSPPTARSPSPHPATTGTRAPPTTT